MPVTIKDIARICNVSRTTVIRALNDTGRISPATKDRILDAAKKMNYQPDLLARVLVKGQSLTIGVLVVDLRNQYFPKMIDAMVGETRKNGYLLNIALHEGDVCLEREIINTMVGYRIDGLILSSAGKGPEFERFLLNLRVPVVLIGHDLSDNITCVGIDERKAAETAVKTILEKGYRHLVFVAPPLSQQETLNSCGHEQRLEGFVQAVQSLPDARYSVLFDQDYCDRALAMINESNEKLAFLCSGDVFASHLMFMLRQYGKMPAKDFGLMGFDCIDTFRSWSPILASVDNSIEEVGSTAVRVLIEMSRNNTNLPSVTIPFHIEDGETL